MEAYGNPAGRLHALLQALITQPGNLPFLRAWAEVLQAEEGEVKLRLGEVGQLLADVQKVVDDLSDEAFQQMVRENSPRWELAIYPDTSGYRQEFSKVGFDKASLNPLAVVASHLRTVRPEGKVPADERLEQLRQDVRDLIDEVERAGLPAEIRDLVITRLEDILRAVRNVKIGGPRKVQLAVEVLVSEIDLHENKKLISEDTRMKIATLAASLWFAFGVPAQAIEYWEGWQKLTGASLHQILPPEDRPPGKEQPQLPAPKAQLGSGDTEPEEDDQCSDGPDPPKTRGDEGPDGPAAGSSRSRPETQL